jgi:hypothetical protein
MKIRIDVWPKLTKSPILTIFWVPQGA